MLSKNNLQERLRKMEPKKNHYSIRKFTVGVASVLIGMTFMEMSNGQTVKADTVTSQVRDQETQVSQEKNSAASELSKNANISTQQEANKQDAASSQKVNEQNAKNKTEETEKTSPLNGSVNSTNEVSPQSSNNTSKPVTVDSNKVGHFAVALNSKKDNKINSTISNKVEENLSENKVIKPSTNIQKSESTTSKIDSSKTTTGLKASLQSPEITDKKLQDLKTTLVAKSSEEANITNATNYPDTNGMVPEDQYIFNQFHLTSGQLTPDKKNWQSLPLVITLATDKNNPGTDLHYYITDDDYTNKYAIGNLPVNQSYRYTSNPYSNAGLTIYNFGKDGISVDSFNQQYGLAHIFGYGKGVEKILENPYEYNNVSNSWGDVVPQTIKQTISYINKNTGEEMPGMPQIEQTGLTGQTYNASQVNKKVIDGYYLINSRVAQGTLSQFKAGETFTKKWVDSAGNTIDENWYQLDNEGLMQLTVNITSPNGTTTKIVNKNVVKPDGSVDSGAYNFANPYVPSTADIKLLYAPVGRIIPVDKDGNEIPNAPQPRYTNDPDDASKVKSNEPVPTVPGYTPSVPTVTPTDPGKDTPVIYTPIVTDKGQVTVVVHDKTDNIDLPKYGYNSGEQEVGYKVDFNKNQTITDLTKAGYNVLNPDVVIPAEITKGSYTVTINVEHTTTTVTPNKPGKPGEPVDPNNPTGPKYPDGTNENAIKRTGTQTIHYTGAGKDTPSDKKQSFDFTRTITFDNVTGKIINTTPWNETSHTFGYEDTPVIDGYHADKRTAGDTTVTPDDLNKTVTVTYIKNGKIIPVGPDGKTPIPNVPTPTYPTDPKNPTEVTPNEPVPNVPGYTPEVPTVTPTDPGKDTPVIYTPVENPTPEEPLPTTIEGTQTIKFETEDGTQLESPNVQKAQFTGSHTFGKVNVPVIPGYVATQTTAGGLTVTESKPNVGQTVIYKKIGKIIPVDSNGNPIPNANQPQYTNDSTNPTKVMPNESVPDVPGYTPESSTVTPVDPTTDTPVVYKKDEIPRKPSTSHKSDKETPSRPEAETSESYESALTTANNTNAKGKNAKSNIGRAKAAAHQNTLPQTGEKDTEIAGLAGLALMAVAGMISLLGGKDRKRKKN